jgi:multiple antibiotic resistance protein
MSSTFFNSFAVLFVAIDAAGIGPLFLLLTEGATRDQRFKIAIESSLIAFTVLIIFAYGGKFFFDWIGVSINSLKIAGGIILFIISIEMLLDKRRLRREESANKVLNEKTIEEISIFPLAIPLIAALTSVLLLVNTNSKDTERLIMVYIALTAVMLVTFFHMIFSAILANYTSKNILNIFSRVIALILASLAIQFIVDGIKSSFGF